MTRPREHAATCRPGNCYAACACPCHYPPRWPYLNAYGKGAAVTGGDERAETHEFIESRDGDRCAALLPLGFTLGATHCGRPVDHPIHDRKGRR